MQLSVLTDVAAVCRLSADDPVPDWACGAFVSMTRTDRELSVVCDASTVPDGIECERNWRCLRLDRTWSFSEVGVLAALATSLAAAGVSLVAIGTFETDYMLVKQAQLDAAIAALQAAGHRVEAAPQ